MFFFFRGHSLLGAPGSDDPEWLRFINNPAARRVVLAELFPEEEVTAWSRDAVVSTNKPIPLGSATFQGNGTLTEINPAITFTGSERVAVVRMAIHHATETPLWVNLGGIPMTLQDSYVVGSGRLLIYTLANPLPMTGANTLSIGWTNPVDHAGVLDIFSNVMAGTPLGATTKTTGTSTTISGSPASATNEYILDIAMVDAPTTSVGAGQTAQLNIYRNALTSYLASSEPGTGSPVAMTWNLQAPSATWRQMSVALKPSWTSAFYADMDILIEKDVVPGGMYAEIVGVYVNDVALVQAASFALVDATSGTFYYDKVAKRIYVHMSDDSNPQFSQYIGVVRKLRLSTGVVDFVDQPLYYPLISGATPELRDDAQKTVNTVAQIASGNLSAQNGDKLWDRLADKFHWRNRPVRFLFGGDALTYYQYREIGTILMVDIAPGDNHCVWRLRSYEPLDKAFPITSFHEWFQVGFGDIYVEELSGQTMPMGWGHLRNAPAILYTTGASGSGQKYLLLDPAQVGPTPVTVTTVRKVDKVTGVATVLDNTEYFVLGYDMEVFGIDKDTYDLYWDGYRSEAFGAKDKFGDIAMDLLLYAGVLPSAIDTASFSQANIEAPMPLGLYIPGGSFPSAMLSELLQQVCGSIDGRVWFGSDGLWHARVWDPSSEVDLPELFDEDIKVWNPYVKVESIVRKVIIYYDRSIRTDTYRAAEFTDNPTGYRNRTTDNLSYHTLLVYESDAIVMASRLFIKLKYPSLTVQLTELGSITIGLNAWDKLRISRKRGPSLTGQLSRGLFQIQSIIKQFTPELSVQLTVDDLSGLKDSVRAWLETGGVQTYTTGTDDERARYAVWVDDDGTLSGVKVNNSVWY